VQLAVRRAERLLDLDDPDHPDDWVDETEGELQGTAPAPITVLSDHPAAIRRKVTLDR